MVERRTVGIVGLGHVGLATAVAFAQHGLTVLGYDTDSDRVRDLARGRTPIFEPELAQLLARHTKSGRLRLEESHREIAKEASAIFLAVPTPSTMGGSIDLSFLSRAAIEAADAIKRSGEWRLLVIKSTVVPETAETFIGPLVEKTARLRPGKDFSVASNPEFLAEGTMVRDAVNPLRVVIGVNDGRSEKLLRNLYAPFRTEIVVLTPSGAELVKYASNAMLANRVSFANEFSRLAIEAGVDVYDIMRVIGMDPRIGEKFLAAGPGFGGSCFSKDLKALLCWARDHSIELPLVEATLKTNERQAGAIVDILEESAPGLKGRTVAVLGLAFKKGTSDTRESRAYPMIDELLRRGANAVLYDPVAIETFRLGIKSSDRPYDSSRVTYSRTLENALSSSDYAIIQTDWDEFKEAPPKIWAKLSGKLVVDARRTLDPVRLRRFGVEYCAVGLGGLKS